MTRAVEDLLPEAVRALQGQWSSWQVAPPVTASDIRRWAIAVYWPEHPPSQFLEAEAGHRLVAPQELNPFAWLPGGPSRTPALPGVVRLFGGCRIDYGVPMREGDAIRRRSRLEGWTPKAGRTGPMLVVEHAHEWRNDDGALVRDARYRLLYRERSDAAR